MSGFAATRSVRILTQQCVFLCTFLNQLCAFKHVFCIIMLDSVLWCRYCSTWCAVSACILYVLRNAHAAASVNSIPRILFFLFFFVILLLMCVLLGGKGNRSYLASGHWTLKIFFLLFVLIPHFLHVFFFFFNFLILFFFFLLIYF